MSTSRAHVRAGTRRQSKRARTNEQTSSLATLLATISPVFVESSSTEVLPTTTTWYPVSTQRPWQRQQTSTHKSDDEDETAKAAAKKRKRLGQIKRKRDRIQQEILQTSKISHNLQSQLTAANKRMSKLQGAEVALPTAKEVCVSAIVYCI